MQRSPLPLTPPPMVPAVSSPPVPSVASSTDRRVACTYMIEQTLQHGWLCICITAQKGGQKLPFVEIRLPMTGFQHPEVLFYQPTSKLYLLEHVIRHIFSF